MRLDKDRVKQLREKLLRFCAVPRDIKEIRLLFPNLTKHQVDHVFAALKVRGAVTKTGHARSTKWQTADGTHDAANQIVEQLASVDKVFVDKMVLLILEIGNIPSAKLAFHAAVTRLEAIR